ncbi:MAG TPA: TonB-dependent receptor [Candidatus Aquilonibacter sp.]|nr:TonB-dependent receptor [Candidatus Aquilonibacter sp.]
MIRRIRVFFFVLSLCLPFVLTTFTQAQQTLGGITGTVTDTTGAVVTDATVTVVNDQTTLTRTLMTSSDGEYTFVNLPIGNYTLTFEHAGFESQKIPSILVQANRTATLNVELKIGQVSQTVTVEETPLLNAVDTTNGYVLDKSQVESIPLPTGSFTGIAILSAGVNSELSSGTGANQGLGNNPIWANGQRDTSNTFLLNGVDASNLFNGKSTSSVASARIVNNTGVAGAGSTSAEPIQSTASPYLAIGQALPTPAPETIQEVRVNTSMYDAQQGATSGAHIDMSTASGTNDIHGQLYGHRGTDWLNAAPYFYNQDGNIPAADKVPELHRYVAGGTVGFPIIKNKLFGFLSYQHTHASDLEIGTSRAAVPFGLTDDRSPAALANIALTDFGTAVNPVVDTNPGDIDPVAYELLNAKLPNGQFVIPSANPSFTPTTNFPEDFFITDPAYFIADQAVADLDYNVNAKDTLALKYYYQHDPTLAPFAYSGVDGFPQRLDAGSQVATITNTQTLTPTFNVAEVFGFIREKAYSTIGQPAGFTPAELGMNGFGSTVFPGITISDDLGNDAPANTGGCSPVPCPVFNANLAIGMTGAAQSAFTGVFQNRFMPSASAVWIHGRHTVTFGGSFSYTQLNARDDRPDTGMIGFTNFADFLQGLPVTYSADGFITTTFLNGDANRYYRSKEIGLFAQDKFQITPTLSLSLGLRWDDHGGLTEKNGKLYNFDPALYDYDPTTDTIVSNGFIVAGNNPLFPTKGVSDSTLTGRQWGLSPRIGVAWSPKMFDSKVVVRAGWGLYYDRGELFTYLSPGFAAGVIAGGPFGVNQSPPWVNSTQCSPYAYVTCSFENPWGTASPVIPSGNPADLFLPNAADIETGLPLFSFADYNRANKLPYTMNETLDIQWQPRNDLAIDIGYVGNLGRHEVVPIPFNQARIASPTNPLCGPAPVCASPGTAAAPQTYTYGYTVVDAPGSFTPINLPDDTPYQETFEGGNVDLRVPYIGYSSESESYTAAGISAYNALQVHVEKRLSHNVQAGFSYTYSHSEDEQSAMGLFYNGNNPLDLRSGYGSSDFDRTHVINFDYRFELPKFYSESSLAGKFVDGWVLEGLTVIQSGQPYSIIDYSGAVGSIYYGTNDGITNPIVPLAPGCTVKDALTGHSGAQPGVPALNAACFTLPLLPAGGTVDGQAGAIPSNDPYETTFITAGQRNIFRQPWQKRADISIVKMTKINDRVSVRYSFDVFNLTNTGSFDIPIDDVSQNINFNDFPYQGQPATTSPCDESFTALYVCPTLSGLGVTNKTISAPRQIQMSLSVLF